MIVRRCLTLTVPIFLVLSVEFGAIQAERWSRQVSNSEWIPLANPRATQSQIEQSNPAAGLLMGGNAQLPQVPQLSLPSGLQQQYQEQLVQLQKTQENIQKLLLLQQQLRAQQQLLQSQGFLPSGFSNAEEDKRLHESGLGSSQTVADVASEDLVPPLPATEALPPVFPAQNFLPQRPQVLPPPKQETNIPQEFASLTGRDFKPGHLLQQGQNVGNVEQIPESQRQGAKQLKESNQAPLVPQVESGQDEEEEVQLVYVPAETLAQRGQAKRGRGRKQYPLRQQQAPHRESQGVDSNDQDAFTRQLLQQIQMEREEKAQFLKEERMKEIARLNEEQRALERKARLQQEALQREQELQRQREAEKKKKELEKLEEMAKQRELEKIREAREKQRLEELERRRLAEVRAKEEKRRTEEAAREREAERLAALERQKELELQEALKQQQILEKQREEQARAASPTIGHHQDVQTQTLPLIRDQQEFHRQHLGETSKPVKNKVRGRQRQRNHYQEPQSYRETTTTPSPNQPPLSVYMGSSNSKTSSVRVSDVLRILRDAKTIAVVDTVGPDTPQVFVGPTSLEPPYGYAKFDLPYLSSIDHNRVERKVDKLPFFVAPLSFDPPPGYSKIPFPAPHIGSVVVNTLDNTDPKDGDDQNPSPTPLIEPNSYSDGLDGGPDSTTPLYEPQTTVSYSQEPQSTPKYEQVYSPTPSTGYSGARFRFRQFYGDNKPSSVVGTSYYEDQRPTTRKQKYFEESVRTTESSLRSPNVETSVSHAEEISYSTTPSFKDGPISSQDPSTKGQDLAAQLALINHELYQQREAQRYNAGSQYSQESSQPSTRLGSSFESEISGGDVNEIRSPIGPTQYSLPAELPAISPHLPGLVNSLLDKNEAKVQTTTTTSTTTTTTTTQRTPTTTYRIRSRQRGRISSTRPRTTTQASSTRVNVDRNRRPYNRSRSRFSTTTEDYRESGYEPTKSRIPETTLKYTIEHRRPASRTQKYRNRDKVSQQSEVLGQGQNIQSQQAYENIGHVDSGSPPTGSSFLQPTAPEANVRQLDSSPSLNDYSPENYPPSTLSTTENYPPLAVNQGSSLVSEDYSRSQNYPQSIPEQLPYHGYEQTALEQTGLEKTPVNGFNYQVQNGEALDQGILQRPKDYQVDGKVENSDFELATTADPRLRTQEDQRYSSIYDVNVPQTQPEYTLTGQDNLHHLESEKIQSSVASGDPNEQPIFVPLAENKQEDYELPISSTEAPLADITTETTTTSTTPVVIRQRLRGRVGSRLHHEPSIQTRNRGSQDEYVRLNAVNQDSTRTSPGRHRTRSRSRTQNYGSQVQTDGNEYIRFHVVQQQRQIATTTSVPLTTTSTTTVRPTEEDIDYGFIRPPNFRPVHPVDRYQAPVTYRPQLSEVPQQSLLPSDETAVDSNPQLLKNRLKYQPTPNRRLTGKPTTPSPPSTTTTIEPTLEAFTTTERIPVATVLPDDAIYTTRQKSRSDEVKQTRVRSRVRRPVKKRVSTTSTTESILEAHNELPLDENYPRVRPQSTTEHQQGLYEDNYDNGGQFANTRNPTDQQYYETSSENYPPEFILNFGNYPEQPVQREEYDQTQLASTASRKYSEPDRAKEDAHSTTGDIYGAESQWSTKLTRTSFQPSFAVNRVAGGSTKDRAWYHESLKDASVPEIITAAPEVSSVTLVVSLDDKRKNEEEEEEEEDESMLMGTTVFGRKTGALDHTEKMNATTSVTGAPTTITRDGNGSEVETSRDAEPWMMDSMENSTEQQSTIDLEKTRKKTGDAVRKGTRRTRVRVRVRPAVDDFVTAESQHFNSALNGLIHDHYKYNPIRESRLTTTERSLSEKSILRDFLTEILKNDEPSPRSTTTESPEAAWTMSPAITTPMVLPDEVEETTTNENQASTTPATSDSEETSAVRSYEGNVAQSARDKVEEKGTTWSGKKVDIGRKKTKQEQEHWRTTKDENWNGKSVRDALNFGLLAKYATKENDVEKLSGDSERIPIDEARLKATSGDEEAMGFGRVKEIVPEVFEGGQESKDEDRYAHPKNHKTKWSEVRYPSAFDRSPAAAWNEDQKRNSKSMPAIPGLVSKSEGDSSVKILSDYVRAIFDSMKNAEEEVTTARTDGPEDIATTVQTEFDFSSAGEEGKTTKDPSDELTTLAAFLLEDAKTERDAEANGKEATQTTQPTTYIDPEDATTLERVTATSTSATSSSTDPPTTNLPLTTTPRPTSTTAASNSTESMLGKILRTSTTTRVSHMTEICYRGRCVMTRPSQDDRLR